MLAWFTEMYEKTREKFLSAAVIALCLIPVSIDSLHSAGSVLTLLHYNRPSVISEGITIKAPGTARLRLYDYIDDQATSLRFHGGQIYAKSLNSGLDLLNTYSSHEESVLALGYHNPFSYLLKRKPAIGGSPWLQLNNNLTKTHMLDPIQIFGNADLIMVPQYPDINHVGGIYLSDLYMEAAYRGYLLQHFHFVASNPWWSLYRRNR